MKIALALAVSWLGGVVLFTLLAWTATDFEEAVQTGVVVATAILGLVGLAALVSVVWGWAL